MNRSRNMGDLPAPYDQQFPGVGFTPGGLNTNIPGNPANVPANAIPGTVSPTGTSSQQPGTAHPAYQAVRFSQGMYAGDAVGRLVLPARYQRRYLLIQNTSASDVVYVGFDSNPSAAGFNVVAGGVYEPIYVPGNAIYLYAAVGVTAYYIEGV